MWIEMLMKPTVENNMSENSTKAILRHDHTVVHLKEIAHRNRTQSLCSWSIIIIEQGNAISGNIVRSCLLMRCAVCFKS